MSDGDRKRPQFGEYASPEEQRAAIKDPSLNPHYAPPAPAEHQAPPMPGEPSTQPVGAHPGERQAGILGHPTDRVFTIALLVIGLYSMISTIMTRGDIAAQMTLAYHSLGIGADYTATARTDLVGNVVAIVFAVLWIVAAGLSYWRMRRGGRAFWIPLTAGVLAAVVRAVGYAMLMLADPTFVHFVQTMSK
jgi:hypothetical protein